MKNTVQFISSFVLVVFTFKRINGEARQRARERLLLTFRRQSVHCHRSSPPMLCVALAPAAEESIAFLPSECTEVAHAQELPGKIFGEGFK